MPNENDFADYEQTMAYTGDLNSDIRKVRGLLMAFGLEKQIKIAYDEWNLRGWHHPGVHTLKQAVVKEDYLYPRDLNDRNQDYTMADAVFTACFLNTLNRNCDIVGMACFAPVVNTRGCIFTHKGGIVLRGTCHVFDLYASFLGKEIMDVREDCPEMMTVAGKDGATVEVPVLAWLRGNGQPVKRRYAYRWRHIPSMLYRFEVPINHNFRKVKLMLIPEYQDHYDAISTMITTFCNQRLDADYKGNTAQLRWSDGE